MIDDSGPATTAVRHVDFIRAIVDEDLAAGRHHGRVATRFPPEPNGYLHIGHAKSICLNFGIADERGGTCNLRFDDTNPTKEDVEYVDAIKEDVAWLGFTWNAELYASDYFEQLYQFAVELIKQRQGLRRQPERRRDARLPRHADRAGQEQPVSRSIGRGEPRSVRADARPASFRTARTCCARRSTWRRRTSTCAIRRCTGSATRRTTAPATPGASIRCTTTRTRCRMRIERITHSLCTLEFEDHRPLYDWLVDSLIEGDKPRQIEFARLNLNYTVMSKRKLLQLVQQGHVSGLERSADADDQRAAPARLHAGIDPRLLRAHRRREEGKRHRRRAARAQRARGSEPPRAARDDGAASAEGRDHQLSRRPGRRGRRRQQPGGRGGRHAQGAVLARAVHRARGLHGEPAEEVLPALAGQGSAAAVAPISSPAPRSSRTIAARSSSCAAPTIRRRAAAMRRTAAR